MEEQKISFNKEAADTLGIESAIILELYKSIKFNESLDEVDLFKVIKSECSFMSDDKIKSNFEKLKKLKLITFNSNKTKASNNNFEVKLPHKNNNQSKTNISHSWTPSKETIEVLELGGISLDFSKTKLKEFKIYWNERNQARDNWNILFLDYMRREWAKENSSNKGMPFCMHKEWLPNNDVYEVLNLSQISREAAVKYLGEFIIYWEENGIALKSWNSKYIEYVKRKELTTSTINDKKNQGIHEPGRFSKDFSERKSDQSWAKEFKL